MTGARCRPPCCQRLRLPLLAHRRDTHQKCRPGFFHQLLTRSGSDIDWATETGLDNITRKLRGYTTLQSKAEVLRSRWLETKCPCLPSQQFPQGQHNVYCRQSFQRILVFLKSSSTGELCSWLQVFVLLAPPQKAPQEGGNWSASELQPPSWQPSRSWYKLLSLMFTKHRYN